MPMFDINGEVYDTSMMDGKEVVSLIVAIAANGRHPDEITVKDLQEMRNVFARVDMALKQMAHNAEVAGRF